MPSPFESPRNLPLRAVRISDGAIQLWDRPRKPQNRAPTPHSVRASSPYIGSHAAPFHLFKARFLFIPYSVPHGIDEVIERKVRIRIFGFVRVPWTCSQGFD